MKIIEKAEAASRISPEGNVIHYYMFADYEVIHTEQPPHTEQVWHHHDTIWETLYVVEGELVVQWRDNSEEKTQLLRAGDLVETERSSHTFKNESDNTVRLMAFKHIQSEINHRELFKTDKILD
jgi:quercetin dioxygenase-like cupin family protein